MNKTQDVGEYIEYTIKSMYISIIVYIICIVIRIYVDNWYYITNIKDIQSIHEEKCSSL